MATRTIVMAGLEVRVVENPATHPARLPADPAPVVVLLHGFSMRADDLAPFGASMGLGGTFLFPDGPLDLAGTGRPGRAWWMIDVARRDEAIARGEERDLSSETPPGLPDARAKLAELLDRVGETWPGRPLFLGGFSQGAILSLDLVLRARPAIAGLILLSGAGVTGEAWAPLLERVRGVPAFQSHGRSDRELSFAAAEALAAALAAAGAALTWFPFEGGHEIPLVVLRGLKKFIGGNAERVDPNRATNRAANRATNGD